MRKATELKRLISIGKKFAKMFLCLFIVMVMLFELLTTEQVFAASNEVTFSDQGCTITYKETATWGKSVQGEVIIRNNTSSEIHNWKLQLTFQGTITSIWNARDISADGLCLIEAETYNADIPVGGQVSFGFVAQGAKKKPALPKQINLILESPEEEESEITFDYALFAGSSSQSIDIRSSKSNFYGDLYSGNDFIYRGSELFVDGSVKTVGSINISGWKTNIAERLEGVTPKEMPDWNNSILDKQENCEVYEGDVSFNKSENIVNGSVRVNGNISINGSTFEGDFYIIATGDITFNVSELYGSGRLLLYSETGDITINGSQIEINGIMYAPNGVIRINASDTTINGRVVSDSICFRGAYFNVHASPEDMDLVESIPAIHVRSIRR